MASATAVFPGQSHHCRINVASDALLIHINLLSPSYCHCNQITRKLPDQTDIFNQHGHWQHHVHLQSGIISGTNHASVQQNNDM